LQRADRVSAVRALSKNTTIRAAVALLLAICVACALSACGGSSGDAQSLLNATFSSPRQIESANVNMSLSLGAVGSSAASGSSGAGKSLALHLSGPFENVGSSSGAQAGQIPHFALQLALSTGGHTLPVGATSVGSALYVEIAGTWFATPASTYTAIQQAYTQATKRASNAKVHSTFASLGIEPGHWLSDPVEVGTTTIDGVQTVHLTATIDVPGFLTDVSKFSQAGSALGLGSATPGSSLFTPSAIGELSKAVKVAHVDIYTGKSDHLLRRLEIQATVLANAQTRSILSGLSSAEVKLLLELSNINKPQAITAPSKPESSAQMLPAIEQLLSTLEGSGLSGGGSSAGGLEPLIKG
jgi:hypothetical protein